MVASIRDWHRLSPRWSFCSRNIFFYMCSVVCNTASCFSVCVQSGGEDGRLFQWHDGPLVLAMKEGGVFLMDEISLADDSVLERLNR